ncbi:glycosyltransferase family 4 protein [Actinoplanes sp. URMC 104]|uniref:glycosyltransferase family 4 protein n=1 Tax=Actinoplanes sp. URMC 104 TaxID=3423409 RepID=UPI003F1B595A
MAVLHNLTQGGAWRRLMEQATALHDAGVEVVEFTTGSSVPVTARPYVLPLDVRAPKLPLLLRPPQRVLDLRHLRAVWRALGQMAEHAGADIIFANPDSVLRGAVPLSVTTTPIVRYVDEPRRIDYEPELMASLNPTTRAMYAGLRRMERQTDRAAVHEATALATNSRYTAGRIRTAYGRDAQIVPCGAPSHMAPDSSVPAHLLSVGSLLPSKGHDLVVEAAARSGLDLPVIVVAYRDDITERQRLQAVADRLGIHLSIRTGISDADLVALYRSAWATLYLATAEPLGLVSLEAQACGSPVIVSAEGGLPETVTDGRTGWVVAREASAAAEALSRMARDKSRDSMARHAADAGTASRWRASAEALIELASRARVADRLEPIG